MFLTDNGKLAENGVAGTDEAGQDPVVVEPPEIVGMDDG